MAGGAGYCGWGEASARAWALLWNSKMCVAGNLPNLDSDRLHVQPDRANEVVGVGR